MGDGFSFTKLLAGGLNVKKKINELATLVQDDFGKGI